jgi:hypothetical protein
MLSSTLFQTPTSDETRPNASQEPFGSALLAINNRARAPDRPLLHVWMNAAAVGSKHLCVYGRSGRAPIHIDWNESAV